MRRLFLSLILLGFTSLMGVVNYLTTIIKLRAPGMTMFRMPLTTWALFITSILVLLATPVLAEISSQAWLYPHLCGIKREDKVVQRLLYNPVALKAILEDLLGYKDVRIIDLRMSMPDARRSKGLA